jgi:hypothetical protein
MRFADMVAAPPLHSPPCKVTCTPSPTAHAHSCYVDRVVLALKIDDWELFTALPQFTATVGNNRFSFKDARLQLDPTRDYGRLNCGRGCTCGKTQWFRGDYYQPRNGARILVRVQPDVPRAVFSAPSGGRARVVSSCSRPPACSSQYPL